MSIIQRFGSVALAMGVALSLARSATAVEVTIDNFTQATNTAFITFLQVEVDMMTPGLTKTATDSGLTGTIGGVRQLTVTATSITGAMSEQVVAGIDAIGPPIRLCYQSTQNADGFVELVYDAGGSGVMPGDLHHAMGIEVDPIFADAPSLPYSVKVTLVDGANASGSSVQSGNTVCSLDCAPMLFPFTDFPGVNPRQIRSITIQVDPNGGGMEEGADFSLGPISTYGTPTIETICDDHDDNDNNGLTDCADPACARALNCIETAPLLSTGMISALVGMLGVVGLVGLGRTGWNK